ncbi:hypothetical protein IRJ41_001277 [Triplophysa rosa]|uniref:Uncharacterized protein n=1 Tax=Triplophysa rosa TaxID=992332 RepID=A0A9W7TGN9_TRIRA|nr:hypothetical protein IRJ41_001277 [Triplophysa rosa]
MQNCLFKDIEIEMVMDPSIVTIESKLLRDLSTYHIIMSASPIENFRVEVFYKVVCILDSNEMLPSDNEDGGLDDMNVEATHQNARTITRKVLLRIQSTISTGTLVLTADDDAMQSVISDLLRQLEESPEPHDEPRSPYHIRQGNMSKAVKGFFRRFWRTLETQGVFPTDYDTTLEARRIMRDLLLKFHRSIANGTFILTADTEDLTDNTTLSVRSFKTG